MDPFVCSNPIQSLSPGTVTSVTTHPLHLNLSSTYQTTLKATNGAGLTRLTEASFSLHTSLYEGRVSVAVNYGRTENVSGEFVELERVSSGEEFVCVFETDVLTVEFSAPLDEQNIDTER